MAADSRFRAARPNSFYPWLKTIAERKLYDKIRAHQTVKRGGGQAAVSMVGSSSGSVVTLLELVANDEHTPSKSAARREAEVALHLAVAELKDDYQQVLRLRYLEGLPVTAVAAQMDRTDRAVHMLCSRAVKKLRKAMGRASKYLSSKE